VSSYWSDVKFVFLFSVDKWKMSHGLVNLGGKWRAECRWGLPGPL
jgi:hypothetical protein